MYTLRLGNSLQVLPTLPSNSIDSIVCDPPYELGFMGKSWDASGIAYNVQLWQEALRVLKPGGHLLAFSGSRTYHRMTCAIEDAGFEVRDQILWVYGSGFPKSLDVSKAIDKAAGVRFDTVPASGVGFMNAEGEGGYNVTKNQLIRAGESTEAAKQWQGWGTALKPAHEPICVARKPLAKGLTVAANVLEHGTGGLNIDGCRVATGETLGRPQAKNQDGNFGMMTGLKDNGFNGASDERGGRWPANLIHDGSDEVLALFPETKSGTLSPGMNVKASTGWSGGSKADRVKSEFLANEGSAARFFYCAKTSKKDRNEGCESLPQKTGGMVSNTSGQHITRRDEGYEPQPQGNGHPTVKPTDLMRYLCRLVTPPGGVVLDPFMGSGSTGKAAVLEGFRFTGIEMNEEYMAIAAARISSAFESTIADMI